MLIAFFQMSEFIQFVNCAQKTWHSYTLTQELEYVTGAHTEMQQCHEKGWI